MNTGRMNPLSRPGVKFTEYQKDKIKSLFGNQYTKNVIIYSHPHAGSTILKCMLGRCENVNEIVEEAREIPPGQSEPGMVNVCKWPMFVPGETVQRDDYTKIFLVREPRYALSSLAQRFPDGLDQHHARFATVEYWRRYLEHADSACISVLYPELFTPVYMGILCHLIGAEYSESMYSEYHRSVGSSQIPETQPSRSDHLAFRTWQINQPIRNMNDEANVTKDPELLETIAKIESLPWYKGVFR